MNGKLNVIIALLLSVLLVSLLDLYLAYTEQRESSDARNELALADNALRQAIEETREDIAEAEQVWVKCRECDGSYEVRKRWYFRSIEEKARASLTMTTPPLDCQKCGKPGIFLAEKCEECGSVFFLNSVPNAYHYHDRCPHCGYSRTEAIRKSRIRE